MVNDTRKKNETKSTFAGAKDTASNEIILNSWRTPRNLPLVAGPRHACVRLANGHGQLWELNNNSDEMHNFHIHQTKFRTATDQDYIAYGIDPSSVPHTSALEIKTGAAPSDGGPVLWNDTIPVEAGSTVFIVINFDAQEQLGRYVYHCHILQHEDHGLMAPMEVVR